MSKKHEFSNGEVTVIWQPDICTHSGNCVRSLGQVFKPGDRPWVKTDGASTNEIVEAVGKCPSGALTTRMNNQ
ncbi:MAG: (4Fe-4S)-binding protein [Acidobacteria bacterium]|nr:(4Fe-4S)-binding protein [Acidobacteriota bacterium]MBK8148694.1 (4Fe-4S)-binding protein [Acidobacteriota bacterium]MBK8810259.1 (4Fe-4S)-binding protein [Acidobacteriota bacterium]